MKTQHNMNHLSQGANSGQRPEKAYKRKEQAMNRNKTELKRGEPVRTREFLCATAILAGLLLVVVGPVAASPMAELDQALERSVLAEDWEKVISLLPQEAEPNMPAHLRLIKGHACLATNRNNESLCLFLGASSEVDLREWEEWTEDYLEQHPESPVAHYFRGDSHARLKEWGQAISTFSIGCTLDPNQPLLRNARGVVFAGTGQTENSFEDFLVASEASLSLADAFANLGAYALLVKDGAKGGIQDYDKAISLSSEFVLAFFGRGCLRIATNAVQHGQQDLDHCWVLAGCLRPSLLVAMQEARAIANSNQAAVALADSAGPGFAVETTTLQKFAKGNYGFSGWALQNALKNASGPAEVTTITEYVNQGLKVNPAAGAPVKRDYMAVENQMMKRGALETTTTKWDAQLKVSAGHGPMGGEVGGNVGKETTYNWSNYSNKFNGLADVISKADLRSPDGQPQGFKAAPPLGRDRGDWPFQPTYGLGYAFERNAETPVAQAQDGDTEDQK